MLRFLSLLVTMLVTTSSLADDFPQFADLPSVKELPDPLVMRDGTPVKTAEEWTKKRRPELQAQVEHYMYGVAPLTG